MNTPAPRPPSSTLSDSPDTSAEKLPTPTHAMRSASTDTQGDSGRASGAPENGLPPTAPAPGTFLWAFRRDLKIAMRRRAETLNLIGFFVLATMMVPFAVGPESNLLARLGPGVIWVMALLAQLTALPMLFTLDHQDGSLEHMLASGRSPTLLVAGKLLAAWTMSALPLILATPVLAPTLSMDMARTGLLMLTLLLGTPTLLILGAIGAALTLGLRAGGALVALLCLPLYVPVLIFGSGAIDMYSSGLSFGAHLALLGAGTLIAVWAGPAMVALSLRTALE